MNRQIREHKVKEALASLDIEGLKVSDYLQSQLNEYIEGRMTHKMMLQMLDEWYLTEVVKERLDGKTVIVDMEDL
jgi:cytochrome c553